MGSTISVTDRSIKSAKWVTLSSLLTLVFAFTQVVILSRYLEPSDFGVMAILTIVYGMASSFVNNGIVDILISRNDLQKRDYNTLFMFNLCLGFVLSAFVYGLRGFISNIYSEVIIADGLKFVAAAVLVTAFNSYFDARMRKVLRFKELSIIRMVSAGAGFIATIYYATQGVGVWCLVIGFMTLHLVLFVGFSLVMVFHGWVPSFILNWQDLKHTVNVVAVRASAALINQLNNRVDQLIIGLLFGNAALGLYSVAYQIVIQPFSRINPILTQVSFPAFSLLKDDTEKLRRGYCKGLSVLSSVNSLVLFGLAATSPFVVRLALDQKWYSIDAIISILSVFVLVKSIGNINIGLILSKERYSWPLYFNIAVLCVVPISLYLSSVIGGDILLISKVLVFDQVVILMASYLFFVRNLIGLKVRDYVLSFIPAVLIGIFMFVSLKILFGYLNGLNEISLLFGGSLAGASLFFVLMYLFNRRDFMLLRRFLYR